MLVPYGLVRFTNGCKWMLMMSTSGAGVGSHGLCRHARVGSSAGSFTRALVCVLTGVILCCSGNMYGVVKVTWFEGNMYQLGGATTADITAATCSGELGRPHWLLAKVNF